MISTVRMGEHVILKATLFAADVQLDLQGRFVKQVSNIFYTFMLQNIYLYRGGEIP